MKADQISHNQELLDDKNPFSPTFLHSGHSIYIPLVPTRQEQGWSACKKMCCIGLIIAMIGVVTMTIVLGMAKDWAFLF